MWKNAVIENCDEVLELFERYLTPVYFSGHLHTQKVMKHLTEPGMGLIHTESGRSSAIPDSAAVPVRNSDLEYGRQYRLHGKDCGCIQQGGCEWETDENLLDFSSYTENYLQTVLKNQIARKLEDVPKELREVMVDFYTDLYKDYYAGVPISYSEKKNEFGYGLWVRYMDPSTEFRQLDGMMRDSISANNHAEIPNPVRLKRPEQ